MGDWAYAVVVSIFAFQHGGATVLGVVGVVRYVSMATAGPLMSSLGDRFPANGSWSLPTSSVPRSSRAATVIVAHRMAPPWRCTPLRSRARSSLTAFRPAQAALLPALARDPAELTAANAVSSTVESVGFFAGPAIAALLLAVASPADGVRVERGVLRVVGCLRRRAACRGETRLERTEGDGLSCRGDGGLPGPCLAIETSDCSPPCSSARPSSRARACVRRRDRPASLAHRASRCRPPRGRHRGWRHSRRLRRPGPFRRKRPSFHFGVGVVLWSVPLLLVTAWPVIPAAVAVMALIGVGNSLVDVNGFTVLQRVVPEEVMSRVFGAVESLRSRGWASERCSCRFSSRPWATPGTGHPRSRP